VGRRRKEPRWITRVALAAIHGAQIREHGGTAGVRDEGLLESALARPRQKWQYDNASDLAIMAAAYVFGLAKNHGFVDGNKRAAFMTAYAFLGLNGLDLDCPETEVVSTMELVAAGKLTERKLAGWFRAIIHPVSDGGSS
jgi:death-on-curing family protein